MRRAISGLTCLSGSDPYSDTSPVFARHEQVVQARKDGELRRHVSPPRLAKFRQPLAVPHRHLAVQFGLEDEHRLTQAPHGVGGIEEQQAAEPRRVRLFAHLFWDSLPVAADDRLLDPLLQLDLLAPLLPVTFIVSST
jgi:hypothetical protein